jgi:hypothetical protein
MLDVAGNLLAIPIKLLDLVRGVKTLQRDSADRIADLFGKIGEALAVAAAEIRQGNVPHGVCGQLMAYADAFYDTTRKVLGDDKARELADLLHENYNVERMAASLSSDPGRCDSAARQLEESAGRFMALGFIVRAKA